MGIGGIALSSALAVLVNAALNMVVRYIGGDKVLIMSDVLQILAMLASAIVMGAAVFFLAQYFEGIMGLALSVVIGAVIYFALCFIFGEGMTRTVASKLFKFGRSRK